MKPISHGFAILAALTTGSLSSSAKVFTHQNFPKSGIVLKHADSFSVECRNDRTGVIDRESVDVDAATVTIEIPGLPPVVLPITSSAESVRNVYDRFGQSNIEVTVENVIYGGRINGNSNNGFAGMVLSAGRWRSHHADDSWWTCANY